MSITELIRRVENKASPVSAGELALFESELGAPLPEDYRAFLVVTNGGYLGGSQWLYGFPLESSGTYLGPLNFLGFRQEWGFALKQHLNCYNGFIPDGLVCIADDISLNAICIGLKDVHRGRIYFLGS